MYAIRSYYAHWDVQSVDGHDQQAIAAAIESARNSDRPSLIACRSVIGFGAPNKAGTADTHGAPLGDEEIAASRERLGWPHEPFDIPGTIVITSYSIHYTKLYDRSSGLASSWGTQTCLSSRHLKISWKRKGPNTKTGERCCSSAGSSEPR